MVKRNIYKEQEIQEEAYDFPYHYVAALRNGFSQTINDTWGICYISTLEFLINKLKEEHFSSIADVGTGDGRLVRELASVFPEKEIVGIDYSKKAISLAKAMNPGLKFLCLDIVKEKVAKRYDVITLIEVFEHIPLDLTGHFVNSLCRMLSKNGMIYLTVPHVNRGMDPRHFQHFTADSLCEYFQNKFIIDEIVYFEQESHRFLILMNKIMTNKYFILNHKGLLNYFYNKYKNDFLISKEKECRRIFVKMIKK